MVEQYVPRLQVAVQDALVVRVDERDGDLAEVHDRVVNGDRPGAEQVFERAVLHVLHDVIRRVGLPPDLEQLHDVAVGEEVAEFLDFAGERRPVESRRGGCRT